MPKGLSRCFIKKYTGTLLLLCVLSFQAGAQQNGASNEQDEEFVQTNGDADELLVEGQRGKVDSGRGVSLGGDELAAVSETGIIEDVMRGIGLLPGVGYTGFFDAMPSIRGGEPRDLAAVLDGFYIENPYHWGGAYSIFDPKMMERSELSHGVFSARYGNTTSGLLQLWSKWQSGDKLHFDVGVSTSAINLGLETPFPNGGIIVMGKVMFWQPFIELAHLFMPISRNVKQAPWIVSGALSANYNFSPNFDVLLTGFIGNDGIGFSTKDELDENGISGTSTLDHFFNNTNGFVNSVFTMSPSKNILIKASAGAGWTKTDINIDMDDSLTINPGSVRIDEEEYHHKSDSTTHVQGRADIDWELGKGFIFAAGFHEFYSKWSFDQSEREPFLQLDGFVYNSIYKTLNTLVTTNGFGTSAYSLLEYRPADANMGGELGLRVDHTYFLGNDFSVQTYPVLNPRFIFDITVLKNKDALERLTLSTGTGLFSSIDTNLHYLEKRNKISDFEMKPSRSATTVIGTGMEFSNDISLNIEVYYKYLFDRSYTVTAINSEGTAQRVFNFDGVGNVWGIDVLLQRTKGTYFEGWLSYSFNFARYRDPHSIDYDDWYYPAFHRFHTVNLVATIKPLRNFHIITRLGFASGKPETQKDNIRTISVITERDDHISEYIRDEHYSDTKRTSFSMPLDIKFSWYKFDAQDRVKREIYFSIENILSLLLPQTKTTVVNRYTGVEEEAGGMAVMTGLAIPLPSFGIKWHF